MKENKMGVMPIDKLIISMSLPIMASMLVQALYNIVDSVFVSRISENALTALSLAFPIQNLMIAVGVGTAVGVNALLARSLGEKDFEKVNKIADNAVLLIFVSYVLFVLIGVFGARPFFESQTNDTEIVTFGTQYLSICCCLSLGIFTQMMFERMLQATGKTIYTMYTQGIGAIINIILDPILIFGKCGLPAMGVQGAAYATVIGQVVAGALAVLLNQSKNHEIQINLRKFKPDWHIIGQIYGIGVPSIIMQAIGSVMNYGMNLILISFTTTATAVFGAYFKLQSFVFMPVFGLNNGIIPIIAYNYGAAHKERVIKIMKHSIVYELAILLIGLAVFQIFPKQLLGMFDASADMLAIGVPALRIISISFVFAGICIPIGCVFQSLGYAFYSMIVSVARQLVVLLPAAYLLSRLGEVHYVWWSFPIAEIMSLSMTLFFLVRIYKNVISRIGEET